MTSMPQPDYPQLRLKRHQEKRLKRGHCWIYSNEIDTQTTPLSAYKPGDLVTVTSTTGQALGIAYINPANLLCARLMTRDIKRPIDRSWLVHKLNIALSLRERCFAQPFYRLVYGESDGLPGLVVDRFGEHLVVQLNTQGMQQLAEPVVEALVKVVKPLSILLRNDGGARRNEDLPQTVEQAFGETPNELLIEENGTAFIIDPHHGQKTGWFYDHRYSRQQISRYCQGKRVLDVFSYIGAFGLQMAHAGATETWCIDISEKALDQLQLNAAHNQLDQRITCVEGDAHTAMASLRESGEKFDVVVVDPPAFIKKKKDLRNGLNAYRKVNEMAMRLLNKDGMLLAASCSMHLGRNELLEQLRAGSRHLEKHLQVIEQCHQGPDHPIHPAIPETEYIKGFIARITSA